MNFIQGLDPFLIRQGTKPIVVAAPHHGTLPNVDSDLVTGPIAQALGRRLNARTIVVSDLRRMVDVNKNPLGLKNNVRHHALRYQNEVFHGLPCLVLEVHGHISGQYPVEVSCGFDLDPTSPGDASFLERLRKLKQGLTTQLGKIGLTVGVGVYPLDRDVKKTATNTYTFQKIRRARNRVGMEWYGLHIELAAELRTSKHAKAPGYSESLADAFATAVQSAFEPLPEPTSNIPTHADINQAMQTEGAVLSVIKAAEDSIEKNVVVLNPKEISTLGFLEGDLLPLYNHGETFRIPTSSSSNVPPGKIAIPARIRRQLDLNSGDWVTIIQSAPSRKTTITNLAHGFVIGGVRSERSLQVWMHPSDRNRLKTGSNGAYRGKGPLLSEGSFSIQTTPEENIMERVVIASTELMKKLTLTIGDTITIETNL